MTTLLLSQALNANGERVVAASHDRSTPRLVKNVKSTYALARIAVAARSSLAEAVTGAGLGDEFDLDAAFRDGRILTPIDHADPAHLHLTGTGLTHLGSADARDKMHAKAHTADATDSLKMFRLGLEGGKPPAGKIGVQPEWFYKGDGSVLVPPGAPLPSPDFALDGGEEPELAGIYIVADDGTPVRLGYALANEFSDHVTERTNYLYLAHSKLRPAALGPEIYVGQLPADIRGTSRIRRDGETIWEKPFLTGEANMSHSFANLERHHFKYALFRRPGDVHVHFFGTATLSFADGIRTRENDVFEIEAAPFTRPLRNPVRFVASPETQVRVL
jgi:hypothetical protein